MQGEIVWRTCPKCGLLVQVEEPRCQCGYLFKRKFADQRNARHSLVWIVASLLLLSIAANAWQFWRARSDADLYAEDLLAAHDAGYSDGWEAAAWPAFYDGYAAGFETAYPEIEESVTGTVSAQRRAAMLQHYAEIKTAFSDWEKENK